MTQKVKVETRRDSDGRPNWIQITPERGKPFAFTFSYDTDDLIKEMMVEGPRDKIPEMTGELVKLINARFLDRVELINLINTISEITNISSVDLIDLITKISEVTNIPSVDLIDRVTLIDAITNIANIASVDLIDRITLIDTISEITKVTAANVTLVSPLDVSGDVKVNIQNASIAVTGTVSISGTVTVSGTVAVSGTVTVSGTVAVSGTVTISGAVTVTSGNITVDGAVTVSGTVAISGTVTVTGTVAISGSVTVTGSVTVSGTVSISGSVTITGAVTVTSGTINIQTGAGTNIIIDKLVQGAVYPRYSTLAHNGASASWDTKTGDGRDGKFFPRGARGYLSNVDVYCYDSAAAGGTITVYVSPYIGAGYLYSATVTVPAEGAAAWRSAVFKKMWNYDSLFIFCVCSAAAIKFGYDTYVQGDRFYSTDGGATWTFANARYWFRATIQGETVGDVNVAGTVNTINIPSSGSKRETASTDVGPGAEVTLVTFDGSGYHEYTQFWADHDLQVFFRVYCDGVMVESQCGNFLSGSGYTASTPKISLMQRAAAGVYRVLLSARYEFKRKFEIRAYNQDGAVTYHAAVERSLCNIIS